MRAVSLDRALRLPLRLHGIQLGQPVDALVDDSAVPWRVVGFELRCGGGSLRFVPYAAARVQQDEITVGSALVLLEEVDFYRSRSRSFRALAESELAGGKLRDLLVVPDGTVEELVVEADERAA